MDDILKLTKDKLLEMLTQEGDDVAMESYYEYALKGKVVASERMAIVAFLLVLIRYKRRKMLDDKNMSPFHFFGVPKDDFEKYYELLGRANKEIFDCLNSGESIPDEPLIEFSEDCAFIGFWKGNYFESLRSCENALQRDNNSFMCNFIKASILEICYINKTNIGYKIQLTNYQKDLIGRCDESNMNFDKEIYQRVVDLIEARYATLDKEFYDVRFTLASETFEETKDRLPEWTEEHDFCLRHKLFLNPLCDFDLFLESSIEDLEELPIDKCYQDTFDEIVDEFKLCRHLTYEYCKDVNKDTKRVQCMVFSYAYSILDKLAFLFKDIYELNVGNDEVSFSKKNLFDRKFKSVDFCFHKVKNNNIYPLYCIMQKVHSKQKITDSIKAIIFDFYELRNAIEHRTILEINEHKLQAHSIFLMKNIKEAILYSYMLLHSFSGKQGTHDEISGIATSYMTAIVQLAKEKQVLDEKMDKKLEE